MQVTSTTYLLLLLSSRLVRRPLAFTHLQSSLKPSTHLIPISHHSDSTHTDLLMDLRTLVLLVILVTAVHASPDFAKCAVHLNTLRNDSPLVFKGKPTGLRDRIGQGSGGVRLYTYDACVQKCGEGNDLYPWAKISDTITTWVLSSIGILLQAPYESNVTFWKNFYLTIRWLGSPIASFTCILWNMRVSITWIRCSFLRTVC